MTNYPADIPAKASWDDATSSAANLVEYRNFKISIPNMEFPYLWGIDTDIPKLGGTFTNIQHARAAIDNYLGTLPEWEGRGTP